MWRVIKFKHMFKQRSFLGFISEIKERIREFPWENRSEIRVKVESKWRERDGDDKELKLEVKENKVLNWVAKACVGGSNRNSYYYRTELRNA